jgi:hypothetical protein
MTVVDITAHLDSERGTMFDMQTLMFADYGEGEVFNYDAGDIRDYANMLDRDGKALTIEQALTLPIRRAKRTIRRGPASVKVTKFVEEAMFAAANSGGMSIPLNTVIGQMTGAITNRKAFFEKVWTEKDGRIVYDKLAWRPPTTCTVKRDKSSGSFQGFTQVPYRSDGRTDPIFFSPHYAFVYIHGQTKNPIDGVSQMTVPYWCYQTKQKIRFLWYSFLEGQSLPKTVVKAATQGEADTGARKLLALRQGGIVGLTDRITHDVLESSGKGADQFLQALRWLDSEASGSALAGFTDLGGTAAAGTGSFALSKDQTDFFLMSREATSQEMQDDWNSYVIADLVRWNFGPNEPCPIFEFGPISESDATMSVTLLQNMAASTSNYAPDEFMDELVEKVAGLLEMDTNRVREGLVKAAKERKEKAEAMGLGPEAEGVAATSGAVDAAAKMVQNMQNPPSLPPGGNQQTVTPIRGRNPDTERPRPFRATRNA